MILIIGETQDISTDYFVEWACQLQIDVLRLNENNLNDLVQCVDICNGGGLNIVLNIDNALIKLEDIDFVWFRRGRPTHKIGAECLSSLDPDRQQSLQKFLSNEEYTLSEFLVYAFCRKNHLGNPTKYNANKLITLFEAQRVGLSIPNTVIAKQLEDLKLAAGKSYITKPLQDSIPIKWDNKEFSANVHEIDASMEMPLDFYYSKFQNKIQCKYELRIFFIEQCFYAGAIFRLKDNVEKPLKYRKFKIVPFILPDEVKKRLIDLTKNLGHKTGSIDMLVDKEGNFHFLEINPVGQYDYLSKGCNYYLDFETAKYIKNACNK